MILRKNKFILLGILLGILVWLIETFIDVFIFKTNENFFITLFFPNIHELWMRSLSLMLFIFLGFYSQIISERKIKESNKKFQKSEENYNSFLENFDGIVFQRYEKLSIGFFSGAVEEITGYSEEEFFLDKVKWNQIIHPKDKLRFDKNEMKFQLSSVKSDRRKYRIVHKDGSIRWVLEMNQKFYDNSRKELGVQGTIHNITKHKHAKQKLKESESMLQKAEEIARIGTWKLNVSNGKVNWSKGMYRIFDFEPDSFDGSFKSAMNKIHPDDYFNAIVVPELAIKKKESYRVEYRLIHSNGKIINLLAIGNVICNEEGELIELIGTVQDITDRKKAGEKLKESEEKFRTIAEQSFMGIVIIQNNQVIYVNEALTKILEYPLKEIITWTRDFDIDNIIHPEDLVTIKQQRRLKREGKTRSKSYRIITKSRKTKWVEQHSKDILYRGKNAELLTIVDVTERKEVENLIIQENEKLMELNQLRRDMITRVSHELKTPLNAIYGTSQMLLNYYSKDIGEKVFKHIENINKGGERLTKLIEDLIDVSRVESKKLDLNLRNENLIEIIKESVEELIYLANKRGIFLNLDMQKELFGNVDKIRIGMVVTNLLSNAIKNTPVNGNIYLKTFEHHDYLDIIIQDTGVGITKKEELLLFTKFGKIERHGKSLGVDIEGSGLGLYISKEIINLHGGQIFVESEGRNKGSIFTIRLPKILI